MLEPTPKIDSQSQEQKPVPEKNPSPVKQQPEKKKTPAQQKDEMLKYEMKYVNGGFNNGVEIKPDRDGKVNIKISIFGGGKQKSLTVGPVQQNIAKLIKAYELEANNGKGSPEITRELQNYFKQLNESLSSKIINLLIDLDTKAQSAIKETLKEI